jgi:hypothetical protein
MGKAGKTAKKAAASSSKGAAKATEKSVAKNDGITAVHLECREGTSNKFYRMKLDDMTVTSTYGRCGTDGQDTVKQFPSEEKVRITRNSC